MGPLSTADKYNYTYYTGPDGSIRNFETDFYMRFDDEKGPEYWFQVEFEPSPADNFTCTYPLPNETLNCTTDFMWPDVPYTFWEAPSGSSDGEAGAVAWVYPHEAYYWNSLNLYRKFLCE